MSLAEGLVRVKSGVFASPLSKVAWAGAAVGASCDLTCKEKCLAAETIGSQWGDPAVQRGDVCIAGCGCSSFVRMIALTSAGDAKLSVDGGDSWMDLSSRISPHSLRGVAFRVLSIHVSHSDARHVAMLTNVSAVFLSRDGGDSWRPVRIGAQATSSLRGEDDEEVAATWHWHPMKAEWALAVMRRSGAASALPKQGERSRRPPAGNCFYSQDGGFTWRLLLESAEKCQWAGRPGGDPRRIVAAVARPGSSGLLDVLASEDFMRSRTVLLGGGGSSGGSEAASQVHFHLNFDFAVVAFDDLLSGGPGGGSRQAQLKVHCDRRPWSNVDSPAAGEAGAADRAGDDDSAELRHFAAVRWPSNMFSPGVRQLRGLEVLHSSEHSAFFFLPAEEPTLPWGHVFRIGASSPDAQRVLADVHRPVDAPAPQWRSVNGLDGVFLANRAILDKGQDPDAVEKRFDAQAGEALDDESSAAAAGQDVEVGESSTGFGDTSQRADHGLRLIVRSYMSMDAGAVWQPLQLADSQEASAGEQQGLRGSSPARGSLHLRHWLSSLAAPGVLLGVGNLGLRLSDASEHHNVYLSRSAGVFWTKVLDGPHEVTLLSHGDAFAAVPDNLPSVIRYSTDSGKNWRDVKIRPSSAAATGLSVRSLLVHPSHTSWRLLASLQSDDTSGLTVVSLDFGQVLQAQCKSPEQPSTPSSDFEKWSPSDSLEDAHTSRRPTCLFGVKTHYVRRKPHQQCRTGNLQLLPTNLRLDKPCSCTMADWDCDVGFYRASYKPDSPCVPLEGAAKRNVSQMCASTSAAEVQVSQGYVKIPGNGCQGGLSFAPSVAICPGNGGFARIHGMVNALSSLTSLALVVLLAVSAAVLYRRNSLQQEASRRKKADETQYWMGAEDEQSAFLPTSIIGRLFEGAQTLAGFGGQKVWRRQEVAQEEEREVLISGNIYM
eukprot:TRINITY_DN15372_c0_g1_i1.p1 TRINITY_DN15372_c0_g1~~TRINITY_DN15372_c0_g1_i1.p1  ORF type:complete len:939 (-),score=199.39 TRINITY_DN15372_c0_g1_i1:86-2902(-)